MKGTLLLAFSGGLDTSFCVLYLKEQGYTVHTATINTGGFSDEELARIEAVAKDLGVASHVTIDARAELFSRYLRYLVFGNVLRGQMYPLSVSAERVCQAVLAVKRAREINATALGHGSTGAGNDQVRFDVAFRALAPDLDIVTPIRDLALSRAQETDYLAERGVQIPAKTRDYSVNEGMWGTSIGGRETLTSWDALPDAAYPSGEPVQGLAEREVIVAFERGIHVSVDGESLDPVALIDRLNKIGQEYGIGRGHHLGDTILGIKGRIGFEAPAAALLIGSHRELEKLVLTGKQLFWKETLGNLYGSLLHEGLFFDPLERDLEAFLESSQRAVTGRVRVRLFARGFMVQGTESPHSLMNPEVASYGESNRMWTGDEAAGFAKLYGVAQVLVARAQGVQS